MRIICKKNVLILLLLVVAVGCKDEKIENKKLGTSASIEFLNSIKFSSNKVMKNDNFKMDKEEAIEKQKKEEFKRLCLISNKEDYIVESYNNLYGYMLEISEIKEQYEEDSKTLIVLDKYQKVKILKKYTNGYYYVELNDIKGYVNISKIATLPEQYIEVDISNQTLQLYENENIYLQTNVVTGLESDSNRKTPEGCYEIYSKQRYVTLKGKDYESYVNYWMPFYFGYGIHDASWRSSFGEEIYKSRGSHGCINMPSNEARNLYYKIDVGTKVLIHE